MDKKQIAKNILARADSALYFLDHALRFAGMKADDIAWQRSILIMLSYSFELIIKSEIVFTTQNTEVDSIDKELKGLGHKIQQIICELEKRGSLPLMNITGYQINNNDGFRKYTIFFNDGKEVNVEDFIDIRYDYIKTDLRNIISHNTVIEYIDKMLELSRNVSAREGSKKLTETT